ncbi:MAG: galactokinase, partial [Planctomycetota bacterium]
MGATEDFGAREQSAELERLLARHRQDFLERFPGTGDVRLFFSPGRVNLMGAHLDYNGGPVMPMTVHCGTFIAARPRTDRAVRMATSFGVECYELDLDRLPDRGVGAWVDYPLGVARLLVKQTESACGLDILFGGNLPIGAGLSSSASICVGTAFALDQLWSAEFSPEVRVDAALNAEREFVGVHCGIMDPFAVGYARPSHLLWLDCKDQSREHLPLDSSSVRIAVVDTNVRRELAHGAFNQRVAECREAFEVLAKHADDATCLRDIPREVLEAHASELKPDVAKRAKHVLSEVE